MGIEITFLVGVGIVFELFGSRIHFAVTVGTRMEVSGKHHRISQLVYLFETKARSTESCRPISNVLEPAVCVRAHVENHCCKQLTETTGHELST